MLGFQDAIIMCNLFFQFQEEADDLVSFREKWQKELQISTSFGNTETDINHTQLENEDIESKAKRFFIRGIEMEKSGKMYEAIQFYRRAVQIVPDIEFKVEIASKPRPKECFLEHTEDGECVNINSNNMKYIYIYQCH